MEKTIEYNFDKKIATRLIKKAISGKFAIVKDTENLIKVGTPPFMVAQITINDKNVVVSGSGAASPVASTCATEIQTSFEEYKESGGNSKNNVSNGSQLSQIIEVVNLLKGYKELFDLQLIDQNTFEECRDILLPKISANELIKAMSVLKEKKENKVAQVAPKPVPQIAKDIKMPEAKTWTCSCGAVNNDISKTCFNCSKPRPESKK